MTQHCGIHGLYIFQNLFYEHTISLLNPVIYADNFEKEKWKVKISSSVFLNFALRENLFKSCMSLPCKGELEKSVECQAQAHKEDLAYRYKF
jgi:hypothetical protein